MTTAEAIAKFNAPDYKPGKQLKSGQDGIHHAKRTAFRVIVRNENNNGYAFHAL